MPGVRAGLATIEGGAGGAPLLLVHGFTGAKDDFAEHVEPLAAAGWHVVVPDLPGHGDSHPDGAEHGFEAYAGAVLAVADDLGWERFAVLGHSMGGVVAQHLAMAAPARLSHLVLMDTSPDRVGVAAELVELACGIVEQDGLVALLEAQRALGNPLDTEIARRVRERRPDWQALSDAKFLRCSPAMYVTMARALSTAPDRSDCLARLAVPTLVLVGEHDELLQTPSVRLASAIPGAELVVVPDAGHNPQIENPPVFFDVVTTFLRRA